MKKKLKLYVWEEFCPDYTDGLAFAIAETSEEAFELLKEDFGYTDCYGPVKEYNIDKIAFGIHGGS